MNLLLLYEKPFMARAQLWLNLANSRTGESAARALDYAEKTLDEAISKSEN